MDIKKTDLVQQLLNVNKKKILLPHEIEKDTLNISNDAKKLSEANAYKKIVLSAPDIREDKIKEVREKLQNGYYLDDKINQVISEKLASFLNEE